MIIRYIIFSIISIVHFFGCSADIIERNDIMSVMEFVQDGHQDLCVIFDLDNTTIRPTQDRGSDEWFGSMVEHLIVQGLPRLDAIKKILPTLFEIYATMNVKPVEPEVVTLIQQLQSRKIHVMALTARSPELQEKTITHLQEVNIDFSKTSLSHVPKLTFDGPLNPTHYHHGILFCGNNPKGDALLELFKRTEYLPTKVIFIDDKRKYLECVERALAPTNIKTITSIRYGYLDQHVANFKLDMSKEPLLAVSSVPCVA